MKMWLYRVMDFDDEGDPMDWGAVTADTYEHAQDHVAKRLRDLGHWDSEGLVSVRFYECIKREPLWTEEDRGRVISTDGPDEVVLELPA